MKDCNANQGSLNGNGNYFSKENFPRDQIRSMKKYGRPGEDFNGRQENGLFSSNKKKLESYNSSEEKTSKDHLTSLNHGTPCSNVKGEK